MAGEGWPQEAPEVPRRSCNAPPPDPAPRDPRRGDWTEEVGPVRAGGHEHEHDLPRTNGRHGLRCNGRGGGEDGGRYWKGQNLCLDLCAGPQPPLVRPRPRVERSDTRHCIVKRAKKEKGTFKGFMGVGRGERPFQRDSRDMKESAVIPPRLKNRTKLWGPLLGATL